MAASVQDVSLRVRSAAAGDEAVLLAWRNDPWIVQRGLSQRTVTPVEHHRWFRDSLDRATRELFFIEVEGVSAGMLRYDLQSKDAAEISIYLLPPYLGQGHGRRAFFATAPGVLMRRGLKRLVARVRKDNPRSRRFFQGLGFQESATAEHIDAHELIFELPKVPHSRPWIGEREAAEVAAVIASRQLAEGPRVQELEQRWCRISGTQAAVAVGSGLGALRLALWASGVRPENEVIVPAYSCVALLNAVLALGATPVLADVTADRWTICAEDVRRRLSPRTRAIIAVHLFGAPAPMAELLKLGVPVIEDCAHGIGGHSDQGTFGSAGTFSISSFYATKMLCAGEGGIVAGQDASALDRIRQARDYGDQMPDGRFLNDKMTDMEAAMALAQLNRLPEILSRRAERAERYRELLAGLADQEALVLPSSWTDRIWYRYAIRLSSRNTMTMVDKMAARGIRVEQPVWDLRGCKYWNDSLPVTSLAFDRVLSLPLYPDLSETEQFFVCAALEAYLADVS